MTSNGGFSDGIHLKTYTAGEDGSRLAEMAKEFGLARQRQPRKQVRERVSAELLSLPAKVVQYMGDPSFQDVRMRSIYTSHDQLPDDEEGERLMGRRPSWMEAEGAIPEEGEDQDPHAHGVGGSLLSAGLGIFKGMVGPAILYLPHAFAAAGFAAALPMLVVTTTLFLYSSTCLLDSWRIESTKETGEQQSLIESGKKKRVRKMLSYPELAYRALGTTGESLVKIGIALMQSGVCLSYLIFVPQNLSKCTEFFMGWHIAPSYFMVVMLVLQIPLSWIRDIRKLTITNLMANLLILFGLTICLGFAVSSAVESDSGRGPLEEIGYKFSQLDPFKSTWFLFIGTSVSKLLVQVESTYHATVLTFCFSYVITFSIPFSFPSFRCFSLKDRSRCSCLYRKQFTQKKIAPSSLLYIGELYLESLFSRRRLVLYAGCHSVALCALC
jgi:solute carrier family 36 (proton-coupled amino acid transporter)